MIRSCESNLYLTHQTVLPNFEAWCARDILIQGKCNVSIALEQGCIWRSTSLLDLRYTIVER